MAKCAVDGCDRETSSKTAVLCKSHYQQKRLGKPLKPLQQQFHGLTEYERFLKWTDVRGPTDCWHWKGFIRPREYGQFRSASGIPELASRAAWRLMKGPIPKGMLVLHKCDNPKCVNPSHLFLGTQQDNMTDMWEKGRARPGVSRGSKHGCAKLNEAIVAEIRASSERATDMALRYGVSITTICDIRKRKIWKHI